MHQNWTGSRPHEIVKAHICPKCPILKQICARWSEVVQVWNMNEQSCDVLLIQSNYGPIRTKRLVDNVHVMLHHFANALHRMPTRALRILFDVHHQYQKLKALPKFYTCSNHHRSGVVGALLTACRENSSIWDGYEVLIPVRQLEKTIAAPRLPKPVHLAGAHHTLVQSKKDASKANIRCLLWFS
ncbi:uncharacterized protein MYCFIDRAFT_178376 [Pseudocercospora fijiensis CIRAD86]|uniref:Uncharacterized protein n=1 Tax=Pseudocercospora fijiensis (strain CIRAD86) TaxID=383855 RepID=M3A5F2_PSEFD|nr:uncharacterized protein MYCFIDRAFT_178376 [Pseudocercospora fijiensis CIRAD86]EME79836.1 hypothetical protein MYCFIDRAFT_178376 [Pseudocercospora fijiensis CIRAD86]